MKKLILLFICVMNSIQAQPEKCTFYDYFNQYQMGFGGGSCSWYIVENYPIEAIIDSINFYYWQSKDTLTFVRRTERAIRLLDDVAERDTSRENRVFLINKMIELLDRKPYNHCDGYLFNILRSSILKGYADDVYKQVLYLCGRYDCADYMTLGSYCRIPEMYNTILNMYEKSRDTTVFDKKDVLYTVALARLGHQPSFEIVKRIYEINSPIRHNESAVRMFVAINDRKSLEFLIKLLETDKMYMVGGTFLAPGHELLIICIKELSPSILGTCWDGVHSKESYAALLDCFYATEDKDIIYSNKFIFN